MKIIFLFTNENNTEVLICEIIFLIMLRDDL